MERVRGIEPPSEAWEAPALPLSYTRLNLKDVIKKFYCSSNGILHSTICFAAERKI
jgi:hypothetical protein